MIAPKLAWYGKRPVARQPLRPVVEPRFERLLDQQATKTRAIDEQVAFDPRAALQDHRFDKSCLAVLRDIDDPALRAHYAGSFGQAAEVSGVEAGVELECIGDLRQR